MIDRNESFVDQAMNTAKNWKLRAILEIVYKNEEGTGLGPTLEFYSLVGRELRSDKTMWRDTTADNMLYPRCMQDLGEKASEEEKKADKVLREKFTLAGAITARSILDDRLVDLPLSPLMWDLVLGRKFSLHHLKKLDPTMHAIFLEL